LALPGSAATKIETRAKVRIGEKNGKFASSVDHFLCDDAEVLNGTKELRVVFVHAEPGDVFRTGLEWWKGEMLACYSDEGGKDPTAFRVSNLEVGPRNDRKTINLLDQDDEVRGQPVGRGRTPIACRFRKCPHFGTNAHNKECRVKGRLTFLIPGGRTDAALMFETKGWNTIESISGTLASCRRSGPLNAPGREFLLSVAFEAKGNKRFPVVTVKEVTENVEVNTDTDISAADALIILRRAVEEGAEDAALKLRIAAVLDVTHEGWRENADFVTGMQARVAEIGVKGAAEGLLKRHETAVAV